MAPIAGVHGERIARVADLLTSRGRREQRRFIFEGPTLLDEAIRSGREILELFVTTDVYENNPTIATLEERGIPVYTVDDRALHRISDLETPTGLVGVADAVYAPLGDVLSAGLALILADVSDPANVGTLLRSAEAFGVENVVVGNLGIDPYHPKVVRGTMGASFRLRLAQAGADLTAATARERGVTVYGLDRGGTSLRETAFVRPAAILVGHERRGLGIWDAVCGQRLVTIPMVGQAESLNAAVAGSIALYEASFRERNG